MTKNQFNQKDILATLLWFSLRGRSLSIEEICKLQYKSNFNQVDIRKIIRGAKGVKLNKDGLYSINLDESKYLSSDGYQAKWRVAKLGGRLLRFVPFIKVVAVVNSLADQTAHPKSDIDFFIITQPNRLFIARTLATAILSVANLRRRKDKINNHICLSFFITTNSLDLSKVKIAGEDIYLAYWIAQVVPIMNYSNSFERLLAENKWVRDIVPNYQTSGYPLTRKTTFITFIEFILNNFIGNLIETILKSWQLKRIKSNPKMKDTDVVIVANKDMLKFHQIDRRRAYRDRWLEAIKKNS